MPIRVNPFTGELYPDNAGANRTLSNLGTTSINSSLTFNADSTYNFGSTGAYAANTYTDRLYVNSTAYIDGGTAGQANLTGNLDVSGSMAVGPSASIQSDRYVNISGTLDLSAGSARGISVSVTSDTAFASNTMYGQQFVASLTHTTGTSNVATACQFQALSSAAGASITSLYGGWSIAQLSNSGNITNLQAFRGNIICSGTGTVTNAAAFYSTSFTSAGGTVTNAYGLFVDSVSAGANNYAIRTNNGNVVINENGDSASDLRVEGDTDANLLFTDASADMVGIGTNAPTSKLDINSDNFRLRTAKTPASATATGTQGQICWDTGYIYVCTATNTWVRATLATW